MNERAKQQQPSIVNLNPRRLGNIFLRTVWLDVLILALTVMAATHDPNWLGVGGAVLAIDGTILAVRPTYTDTQPYNGSADSKKTPGTQKLEAEWLPKISLILIVVGTLVGGALPNILNLFTGIK
jgi:hypothetical protein